jgi:hypothetical protein
MVKAKLIKMLNLAPSHADEWGNGGVAPCSDPVTRNIR